MTPSPGSSTSTSARRARSIATRVVLVVLCAPWSGCAGAPKDTGETPRERCPYGNLESYCAYEFGGPDPTHEEANRAPAPFA